MKLIDNIVEEHSNRTKWIDENLTIRERARITRQCSLSIIKAFIIYFIVIGILYIILK